IEALLDEHLDNLRCGRGKLSWIYMSDGAVNGDEIALLVGNPIDSHCLGGVVDLQRTGTAHTNFTHLPRDQRSVRTDAAFGGENPLGGDHPTQVSRGGFIA